MRLNLWQEMGSSWEDLFLPACKKHHYHVLLLYPFLFLALCLYFGASWLDRRTAERKRRRGEFVGNSDK